MIYRDILRSADLLPSWSEETGRTFVFLLVSKIFFLIFYKTDKHKVTDN